MPGSSQPAAQAAPGAPECAAHCRLNGRYLCTILNLPSAINVFFKSTSAATPKLI
jgi:hypothetical protein